jgi:hypothetical protein
MQRCSGLGTLPSQKEKKVVGRTGWAELKRTNSLLVDRGHSLYYSGWAYTLTILSYLPVQIKYLVPLSSYYA